MTKEEKTLDCCGQTVPNTRLGRCRHRQQMMKLGVDCPLPRRRHGVTRKYSTPERRDKDRLRQQKHRATKKAQVADEDETFPSDSETFTSDGETLPRDRVILVASRDELPARAPKGTIFKGWKKHQNDWYTLDVDSDTTYGDANVLSYE